MAEHNCPKCSENMFTWFVDDEVSQLTLWYCRNCGYHAKEDESYERKCAKCGKPYEIRLEDEHEIYWWCSGCDSIAMIKQNR